MIGFQIIPTSLELNGPTLSFLEQPVGISTIESTASFTGIVTSTAGTGHLSYQWYEVGVGVVGSASTAEVGIGTTLTLTDLTYEDDSGRQFYLESTYVASAYQTSSPVIIGGRILDTTLSNTAGIGSTVFRLTAATDVVVGDELTIDTNTGIAISDAPIISIGAGIHTTVEIGTGYTSSSVISTGSTTSIVRIGTARSTGNALNAPLNSNTVTLGIAPTISITTQPGIATVVTDASASFGIEATVTDGTINNLTYRWQEDGSDLSNSTTVAGSSTTTLTLTGLVDPDDSGRQFYLESSYVASAYGSSPITAGTARSTGNALNAPLNSDTVTLGVTPTISITTQPGIATVVTDANASFGIAATVTDGTINNLTYRWQEDGSDLSDSTTVAGSATTSLTISSATVGVSTIRCVVSHPSASNSPLNSNTVDFNVVLPTARKILYIEEYDINATLYSTQEVDLVDGALEIIPDQTGIGATSNWNRIYSIHAPEDDLSVKVTLSGAAGEDFGSFTGGAGGESSFNLTLTQSQEYVANLGASIWPSGGNSTNSGDGGGGSLGGNTNEGGTGFDGLGSATGTLGGNTRKVGVIKIEAV